MFGFFKRYDVELSPPVQGRITNNGKPISGLQVERSIIYEGYDNGEPQIDYALTNTNGEFSFQEIIVKSRLPGDIFGQNMQVSQEIIVDKDPSNSPDDVYIIWSINKSWEPISIFTNLLMNLNTDLTNKELLHEIDASSFGGRKNQPVISICYFQDRLISSYDNQSLEPFLK